MINNPNLEIIDVSQWTREQWLTYRKTGIGASEVATIMGYNPYEDAIKTFYKKLGMVDEDNDNFYKLMGRELEPLIEKFWRHWDGNTDTLFLNLERNTPVQDATNPTAYIRNKKYPHLFVSVDRFIGRDKITGVLELKSIGGFEYDKWETGIPPYYLLQLQTQMLVTELPYAEIAVLKDIRDFNVVPFEASDNLQKQILETTQDFWERVERARKSRETGEPFEIYEPPPTDSELYEKFYREKYESKLKEITCEGTPEALEWAKRERLLKSAQSVMEKEAQFYKNNLLHFMKDAVVIDFHNAGQVIRRSRYNNRVKVTPPFESSELIKAFWNLAWTDTSLSENSNDV